MGLRGGSERTGREPDGPDEPLARRSRRSTIEDVASGAGVSVATVSRALRGLPNVAASTRAKVAAVASSLEYHPDPAAARLAAGRSTMVTAIVPHLSGWYFSTVVAGAEAVCAEAGYELSVVGIASRAEFDRLLDERAQLERRTDGLIVVDLPLDDDQVAAVRWRSLPVTTIGTHSPPFPSVGIDDVAVGRIAAEHLLDLGHTRIGLIGGRHDDPMEFVVPRRRRQGFLEALAKAGVDFEPGLDSPGNFGIDDGQEAMRRLLEREAPPTAVFAMSDEMAFGALMELRSRGLRAGVDVSVIGVDDHEFARVVDLTTIRQPVSEHGATAARIVIDQIRGVAAADGTHREASIELVVRSTTGPPASA